MTAEFAAVIPAVILVLAACLGLLRIGTAQITLADTAAVAARSEARNPGSGASVAGRLVPGARVTTHARGDFRCLRVQATATEQWPLNTITLTAEHCAPADSR